MSITAVDVVNRRSLLIDEIREEKADAFDFYVSMRSFYAQNRARRVKDSLEKPDEEALDDLYYVDEEDGNE